MAASLSVAITYVPADCGSIIPGKSKAPEAFRSVGIVNKLLHAGIQVVTEHQALPEPAKYLTTSPSLGGVRNEELDVDVCRRVYYSLRDSFDGFSYNAHTVPSFQLILGGECCMLPGILAAFWRKAECHPPPRRVGLIYIDADTDLASPTDSGSIGVFAGMNMAHLTGSPGALKSMEQFCRQSGQPVCDASNTVFFGLNMSLPSNKREHFAFLFDNNYKVVSSVSVAREPETRAREALNYLEDRVDFIMVHLDVDSIDPQMFPLANVPNLTGVGFEQMMQALKVFLGSEKVVGLTVAEVNPDHDPKLEMVERLAGQITEMLGARASFTK